MRGPADGAVAALAFDLDGTLIDSKRDIQSAVNRMRADLGLPPLGLAAVASMVGEGARVLVRRALPPEATRDGIDTALADYLAHYAAVCLETTALYPGVAAMLEALSSRPLAVLTNKPEDLSRRILTALGAADAFQVIIGGDTLPTRKPNPAGLLQLADRFGCEVTGVALIGDSGIDAETAAGVGSPFGLALWGEPPVGLSAGLPVRWRLATPADVASLIPPPAADPVASD